VPDAEAALATLDAAALRPATAAPLDLGKLDGRG
jgi:hypothetical protein